MNKLEELYAERNTFTKYGREVPIELQQQIAELEKAEVCNHVLPLFSDIAPRDLELKMPCDILIAIEYKDGRLTRIGCTNNPEQFFSDSNVTALSIPDEDSEDEDDEDSEDDDSEDGGIKRSKSIKFTVKFSDGKTIYFRNALNTMIEALKYMGLERASKFSGEDFKGFRLVSRQQRITDDGRIWQKYVDGWWIYRNLSNSRKVRCLKGVSKLLNIPLEIIYDEEIPEPKHQPKKGKRTMYSLNGPEPYAKNRSVLEAVRLFLKQFPDASFEEVAEMFPASLQGSYGVVRSISDIEKRSQNNKTESDRWFLDPSEILTAHDGVRFAVSSEWGNQFPEFQKHLADNFGWTLKEV